jgi:hypothetical protein
VAGQQALKRRNAGMNLYSFDSFVADYKKHLATSHDEMTQKCSEADCANFRMMLARLAVAWLARAGDVGALTLLRDQITAALRGSKQLQ